MTRNNLMVKDVLLCIHMYISTHYLNFLAFLVGATLRRRQRTSPFLRALRACPVKIPQLLHYHECTSAIEKRVKKSVKYVRRMREILSLSMKSELASSSFSTSLKILCAWKIWKDVSSWWWFTSKVFDRHFTFIIIFHMNVKFSYEWKRRHHVNLVTMKVVVIVISDQTCS